jgi:hypothetical protein
VDDLMRACLGVVLTKSGGREIPFVWFWPCGSPAAAVMTHDVEGAEGRKFCAELMAVDEAFGVPAAFQIVPKTTSDDAGVVISDVRDRGFEVNLHDLTHDGSLFDSEKTFRRHAEVINEYAARFGIRGFRAGAMYRNQAWFDAFEFSYDMSVPNAAQLEPQRGGCCTTFPYFVGNVLELPLTTTQDYSLFHILGEYSIELWRQQIRRIASRNGLITFITHPDYLIEPRAFAVYRQLLQHLVELRAAGELWMTTPGEVNDWWRSRGRLQVVVDDAGIRIEGPGRERARLAYARLEGGAVVYRLSGEELR